MSVFSIVSVLAALYPLAAIVMIVLIIIWVNRYLTLKKEQNDLLREIIHKIELNK